MFDTLIRLTHTRIKAKRIKELKEHAWLHILE